MRLLHVILLTLIPTLSACSSDPDRLVGRQLGEVLEGNVVVGDAQAGEGEVSMLVRTWVGECVVRVAFDDRTNLITEATILTDTWGACSRAL